MPTTIDRKGARLRKTGGSRSVVLPSEWLNEMQVTDRVELTYHEGVITIEAPHMESPLEDRPEFALFLDTLRQAALLHPEHLRNAADATAGDADLFAGVEVDDE